MLKPRFSLLLLAVFVLATPAVEAQRVASLAMRALRPMVSRAVESSSDKVEDADPFVFSVIFFLERHEQRAANSFVEGLINNDINDEQTVRSILSSITGISLAGGIALTLAGQDNLGERLARYGVFIQASPYFAEWRRAVAAGHTVRIVNGEMVITGGVEQSAAIARERPGYRQTRENEVLPYLNIVHGVPGARVYVNGSEWAISPHAEYMFDRLPAGLQEVTIRDKYHEATVVVFVNPGRETDTGFDEIELPLERGRFLLTVDPGVMDLPVFVGNELIGFTPIEAIPISAGRWTVRVDSEWNDPVAWHIDGHADSEIVLTDPINARGAICFGAIIPEDSRVTINGNRVNFSYDRIFLDAGNYTVEIAGETFYPAEETVSVTPARSTRVNPELNFRTGSIIVEPLPVGAVIALDGIEIPWNEAATILSETVIGAYELVLAPADPQRHDEDTVIQRFPVSVSEGQSTTVRPGTGKLKLDNLPDHSSVTIAGYSLETTSLDDAELSMDVFPGSYTVALDGPLVQREERVIRVDTASVAIVAFDAIGLGTLDVSFSDAGEMEILNAHGTVVHRETEISHYRNLIPEGSHLVRARLADDPDWAVYQTTTVNTGQTTQHQFTLGHSTVYQLEQTELDLAGERSRFRGQERRRVVSWVGTGITTGAAVVTGFLVARTIASIEDYDAAVTSVEARRARSDVEDMMMLSDIGLISTGVLAATTGVVFATTLGQRSTRTRIAELEDRKRSLEANIARQSAERALIGFHQRNGATP